MFDRAERMQSLEETKAIIIENINFRSGVVEESTSKESWYKIILDVRWKGNVHLEVHDTGSGWGGRYYYVVFRNGETVSAHYRSNKLDEKFFKSLQKLVDEIENGDFDKKKTHSEQVMEIVQKRNLTSYMNQTLKTITKRDFGVHLMISKVLIIMILNLLNG